MRIRRSQVLIELLRSLLNSSDQVFKLFWTGRSDFAIRVSEFFRPNFQVHITIELALEKVLQNHMLQLRDAEIIFRIQDALEAGAQEMFVFREVPKCTTIQLIIVQVLMGSFSD